MVRQNILLIATTASMIKNFNMSNIEILQKLGAHVYVGTNFEAPGSITVEESLHLKKALNKLDVTCYQINFERRTGSFKNNIKIIKQIRKIIKKNNITGVHVQSPLGGALGRIAAHNLKNVKILYTAHGFQFFPGGPKRDWIIFYPIERFLSSWCDAIITINKDDYKLAQKFNNKIYYLPGVGTNVNDILDIPQSKKDEIRKQVRKKLNVTPNDFLVLSVGELTNRKNHQLMIKALSRIKDKNIKYVIAGVGQEKKNLQKLVTQYHLKNSVKFLGLLNKSDLSDLYFGSDLNVFVSKREGLGFGGLDGVIHGVYIIGNGNTGMKDYIINNKIGRLIYDPESVEELTAIVTQIVKNKPRISVDQLNYLRKFDYSNINKQMKKIYKRIFFDE